MTISQNSSGLFSLAGKISLVTGAGGEIGQALAAGLAANGSKVALSDIDQTAAERAAEAIRENGGDAIALPHDVTSPASWKQVFDAVTETWGAVNILANVAGVIPGRPAVLADVPLEEWRRSHAVNLDGSFLGVQAGVKAMAPGGSIINIGSIVGYFGARSGVAYGTSKGAIRGLTTQTASSCIAEGHDLRINTLHPGYILTSAALGEQVQKLGSREAAERAFATRNPRNRCMSPDALVGPLIFLASDASQFMNGAEIVIDDGMSTQMPGTSFAKG